jgi:RNA polymerase sigma-70 factor (ECF subfamily)
MRKDYFMTERQREYAAEHHNLVYKYLSFKRLGIDTYYDIVITGYLRAVVNYDEREELRKYSFSTIAWKHMDSDLRNYWRYLSRAKRKADVISLDAGLSGFDGISFMDTRYSAENTEQELNDKLLWLEVQSLLTESQWTLIKMLLMGYPRQTISRRLKIPYNEIDPALFNIWSAVKGLLDGQYSDTDSITERKGA